MHSRWKSFSFRCSRRQALSRIAGATVAVAVAPQLWAAPVPAGLPSAPVAAAETASQPAYDVFESDWHDAGRNRPVPARLYWPQGAKGATPLIVFSHGIGGSRAGYSYLGRYWASHGYASLHVQHVGSDRALWFGNIFTLISRLQSAAQESEAIDRVRDLSFALDKVLAGELGNRIDRTRIVAAGHSYGANTVLLASGAKVQRNGAHLALHDPRFSAAIVMSAPPFYGETDLKTILAGIRIPTLHVTATADVIQIPGYSSPASDRIDVFDAVGGPSKTLAVFEGGSHSIFTDRGGTGGAELNPRVKAATQALSLAFLRKTFEHRDDALASWGERYQPLVARFVHQ
jgi:predicted dienelactone hydrolase